MCKGLLVKTMLNSKCGYFKIDNEYWDSAVTFFFGNHKSTASRIKSRGLHLKQWGCLHLCRKTATWQLLHITCHICMHTLQSPLLAFDNANTIALHQSSASATAQSEKMFWYLDQTEMTVTSHCASPQRLTLLTNKSMQSWGNGLFKHCEQSSNCIHYYKEKLWWIEKNKTKQKDLLFRGCC